MYEDKKIKAIFKVFEEHRSIRQYRKEPIPYEDLKIIMEAGRRAPTDASLHLWTAIRITDDNLRKKIAEKIGQQHVYTAGEFFVFLADLYRVEAFLNQYDKDMGKVDFALLLFAAIDAALAAENMSIMAEALGYGTCFIGGIQSAIKELIRWLSLPKRTFPLFGLTIGIIDRVPAKKMRLPTEMLFHENFYRNYDKSLLLKAVETLSTPKRNWLEVIERYAGKNGVFEERNKKIVFELKDQGFDIS